MSARILAAAITTAVLAACGTDDGTSYGGPDQLVDTIGDTIVARTLSGSVWGGDATLVPEVSIGELEGPEEYLFGNVYAIAVDDSRQVYVLDSQAEHVRVFDAEGTHLRTLGGRGEGPGELQGAASVAVLSDGRVLVQEVAGFLIEVYGPDGRHLEQWAYNSAGIIIPQKPMAVDRNGRIHVTVAGSSPSRFAFEQVVRLGPDGTHLETLVPPGGDFEPPSVTVRFAHPIAGHETGPQPLPLTARHYWTTHPGGHFLSGISTDYRIDLARDEGVLRIERAWEPIAIPEAERDHHRERVTRNIRRMQDDWSWNGPPLPETRPPFRGLVAGRDGTIWVQLWTEARSVANEQHNPDNPFSDEVIWESPVRYDVFGPDGTYLGALTPPDDLLATPEPIFDGDRVWAVARDELGVQRVVRYRIVVGGGSPAGGGR